MSRHRLLLAALLAGGALAGCTNGVVYDANGLPPQTSDSAPAAAAGEAAPAAAESGGAHAGHAGHEGAGAAAAASGQTADPTATLP